MQKLTRYNTGFTLVEVLASVGILVTFLTAALVSFTATQNLSEGTQQQAGVLQEAKAKLEEMRAMDFSGLRTWYETQANRVFDVFASDGTTVIGKGAIVLTDVYNDDPVVKQLWLGAHDDFPLGTGDNWIQSADPAWSTGARYIHTSVVFNNKIWVLGGLFGPMTRINEVWSSSDGITWNLEATPAWSTGGRAYHTSVVFNNKIWVLGGWVDGPGVNNEVWNSSDGANWTQQAPAPMWSVRYMYTSVVFNNKIWVLGGFEGATYFNEVWSSSDGITWNMEANPAWSTGGRAFHTSVVFNNKIWVLGGFQGTTYLNEVWSSSDGITWNLEANPAWSTGGRGNFQAVVLNGKILVLGGMGGGMTSYFNEVWSSEDGANWNLATSTIGNLRDIANHSAVIFGNKFWVIGGRQSDSNINNKVLWSYGAERMYQADITISWRQRNGRIVGEDTDLDGVLDAGEDANGNGILDSPVHITGLLANRGYPSQIYMGRE